MQDVHPPRPRGRQSGADNRTLWLALGAGVILGAAAFGWYEMSSRNRVRHRPSDSAPGRTARRSRFGRYAVTGRTVTINRPRAEVYAKFRDFARLPEFMEHVRDVRTDGDLTRWTLAGPFGDVEIETRIVQDRENEQVAWRSTDASRIETEGRVSFRDAPGGRGTEVEGIVAYVPPAGELGRWIAKAFQAEPSVQARRDLKRLKMLLETGEIATSRNRRQAA